ncbi:hypothetical protein CN481_16035 [Bacillus sp. AFS006103]|nr:hypothetical protein CN481_16035 [Bacillus sp. AFS006103]
MKILILLSKKGFTFLESVFAIKKPTCLPRKRMYYKKDPINNSLKTTLFLIVEQCFLFFIVRNCGEISIEHPSSVFCQSCRLKAVTFLQK